MLYRASVTDVKCKRLSRRTGYLAVVMQHYPRFLTKEMIDEYIHDLAPQRELFAEFKARDRDMKDHDAAFAAVDYENRFELNGAGMAALERLSTMSRDRDVFLLCQCQSLEKCHGDLLLLLAKHHFAAPVARIRIRYPGFEDRLNATSGGNSR